MPGLSPSPSGSHNSLDVIEGLLWADNAVNCAAVGLIAEKRRFRGSGGLYFFAMGIELALKSVARRNGVSEAECKAASHRIAQVINLVEKSGTKLPDQLKSKLNDDDWFSALFGSRYPGLKKDIFFGKDYEDVVASILELPSKHPLSFDGGSARAEIDWVVGKITQRDADTLRRTPNTQKFGVFKRTAQKGDN
jgi:hypothetical protein